MKKAEHRLKLNNTGAALVTVIVVIAFISVMVTVLLYSSGINTYMKTTDMKIKNNFYSTEIPLEQIRSLLVDVAGDAYEKTYKEAIASYAFNASSGVGNSNFNSEFVGNFQNIWSTRRGAGVSNVTYIKSVVDSEYIGSIESTVIDLEPHETEGYLLLKGIKVRYVEDGYESVIETDYIIKVPEIDMDIKEPQTTWDVGAAEQDKVKSREELDLLTCVNYYNWVKK